jgi:hypothetical protein
MTIRLRTFGYLAQARAGRPCIAVELDNAGSRIRAAPLLPGLSSQGVQALGGRSDGSLTATCTEKCLISIELP